MSRTKNSDHSQIIRIFSSYLKTNYELVIEEYNDSGNRLDIFTFDLNGVSALVEVIWKNDYKYDMLNVLSSQHKIKVVIVNKNLYNNEKFKRDFIKRQISEEIKGYVLLGLYDGTLILNNDEEYMKIIINDMVENTNIISTRDKFEFEKLFDYHLNKAVTYFKDNQFGDSNEKFDELESLIKREIVRKNYSLIAYPIKLLFKSIYSLKPSRMMVLDSIMGYSFKEGVTFFSYLTTQFNSIMMDSMLNGDVTQSIEAAKFLFELGSKYLSRNFLASVFCYIPIDNVCSDYFDPELLAYQILFGSIAHGQREGKESDYLKFVDDVADAILVNYDFSFDAYGFDENDYLDVAIEIAKNLQSLYNTDVENFLQFYNFSEEKKAIEEPWKEDIQT